jgi:hypothetical protein
LAEPPEIHREPSKANGPRGHIRLPRPHPFVPQLVRMLQGLCLDLGALAHHPIVRVLPYLKVLSDVEMVLLPHREPIHRQAHVVSHAARPRGPVVAADPKVLDVGKIAVDCLEDFVEARLAPDVALRDPNVLDLFLVARKQRRQDLRVVRVPRRRRRVLVRVLFCQSSRWRM